MAGSSKKLWIMLLVVAIAAALFALGIWFLRLSDPNQIAVHNQATNTSAVQAQVRFVAVVNEQQITEETWQRQTAVDRAMSLLAGQPQPTAEQVLDRLINARLVLTAAKTQLPDLGFSLAQAEERLTALLDSWGKNDQDLAQALQTVHITRSDLLEELQELLLIEAYLNHLNQSTNATLWLKNQRQTARVSIYADLAQEAALPITEVITTPSQVPAENQTLSPNPQAITQAGNTGSSEGMYAPDFELMDLNGQPVQLSSFRGQPVVINFWATWCPACQKEFPAVRAAYERYAPQGVVLLGVDLREPADLVSQFVQAEGLAYPILLDSEGSVTAQYNVFGIPTTVFVDAQGIIRSRLTGPLTEEKFDELVAPLLAQTSTNPAGADLAGAGTARPQTGNLPASRDFSLQDQYGQTFNLKNFLAADKEAIILVFYRGQT